MASASDWRPDWYCASASRAQRCSRNGCASTRARRSASTESCRPARSAASSLSSWRVEPQALEPLGLDPAGVPVPDVEERVAPPQRERLLDDVPRSVGLAAGQQVPGVRHHPVEPLGIHLATREVQPVPVAEGVDRLLAEVPSQPHDAALDELAPGRRLVLAPQRIRQSLDGDDVAPARGQGLEDDPVASGELEGVAIDGQWSQDLDAHDSSVRPPGAPVNAVNTRAIPR